MKIVDLFEDAPAGATSSVNITAGGVETSVFKRRVTKKGVHLIQRKKHGKWHVVTKEEFNRT